MFEFGVFLNLHLDEVQVDESTGGIFDSVYRSTPVNVQEVVHIHDIVLFNLQAVLINPNQLGFTNACRK